MRTQADDIRDDIRDKIEFLEFIFPLVNQELCPRYYKGLINEIMDLKSILINIQ